MQSFRSTEAYLNPAAAGFRLVDTTPNPLSAYDRVLRMASENAVVIFSLSECCMSHVVKRLLLGMGVSPAIHELDEEPGGHEMLAVLHRILGSSQPVPAVFVGGKLVGGLESVMSRHINGSLVPLLKDAGALWL